MMARVSDVIRGWLGWCPNGHAIQAKKTGEPGTVFLAGTAKVPGLEGAGDNGAGGPSDKLYEHTQRGTILLVGGAAAILICLGSILFFGPALAAGLVIGILVFVLAIMTWLTVSITDDHLKIHFGPVGFIRKEWLLSEIITATPVTNQWVYGYGIRWTPDGPLYNVAGSHAVEILLQSGNKVRIGTDEPDVLCRALQRACMGLRQR